MYQNFILRLKSPKTDFTKFYEEGEKLQSIYYYFYFYNSDICYAQLVEL